MKEIYIMTYQIELTIPSATQHLVKEFASGHGCAVKSADNNAYIFSSDHYYYLYELAESYLNTDPTMLIIENK
jgi:hypothetical protein